jgi:tRNA 2-thiouridine synthesizing protein A
VAIRTADPFRRPPLRGRRSADAPLDGRRHGGDKPVMDMLDLRGLKCPLPALKTRKALTGLAPGAVLTVACTDPLAEIDIPHVVNETGDALEESLRDGDVITFRIRKR